MKKIEITFHHNGTQYTKTAVINDDINEGMILADHPLNSNVSCETGMADELGIWHMQFDDDPEMYIECDFMAGVIRNGYEHLTLDPCEVLLWSKDGGKPIGDHCIPFHIELTDL